MTGCIVVAVWPGAQHGHEMASGVVRFASESPRWPPVIQFLVREPSVEMLRSVGVRGLIASAQSPHWAETIRHGAFPVVNVSGTLEGLDWPAVCVDDDAIGTMAAEHLLERKFEHFACVSEADQQWSVRRARAFRRRILAAGRHCYEESVALKSDFGGMNRYSHLMRWVLDLPRPLGMMATNDWLGSQMHHFCMLAKLAVPDEVAIISVDNEQSVTRMVPLTSIRLRSHEQGYRAAALLEDLMSGAPAPADRVLIPPGEIVLRQSTDTQALGDAEVAAALRYIRAHAYERINVEDVLRQVAMSRRTLERRFAAAVGHGPLTEINRLRVARAEHLLTTTTLPAATVATLTGFSGYEHFLRCFRGLNGQAPDAYRRAARQREARR